METIAQVKRSKTWISRGLKTQLPWRLLVGSALGAVFIAVVVGFPYGSTDASVPSDTAVSNGPSHNQQRATDSMHERLEVLEDLGNHGTASRPSYRQQRVADNLKERQETQQLLGRMTDSAAIVVGDLYRVDEALLHSGTDFFGEDAVETLGYEVLMARLNSYQADGLLSSRDLERLDQEIGVLMMEAVEKSSEARAAYDREIERLEEEINALLAEARQDPASNPLQLDREVRRLDFQIGVLRLAAMD